MACLAGRDKLRAPELAPARHAAALVLAVPVAAAVAAAADVGEGS